MPNLDFYAVDEDHTAVLDAVFRLDFRVFEMYSDEGTELREFEADAIARLRLAYEYGSMLRAEPLPDIAK
ncbi:hypothetical protein [Kribbella sp. C-35]|uniref:hypothetical protein n=1 Tax=Kribbella sp. C-35 TaxID=2789276 RepID=UPI00397C5E09